MPSAHQQANAANGEAAISPVSKLAAIIALSFSGLVALVFGLAIYRVVTPQMALLMLIGLAGLYIGFGILFLVYRLVDRLD
ncbi:MAG: hypothetical protein ACR2QB_04685 [Gammaproteobacteria bacterium]